MNLKNKDLKDSRDVEVLSSGLEMNEAVEEDVVNITSLATQQ